jgi:hypothetical protein
MKETGMGGACSMLGKDEECIQNINQKPGWNKWEVNIRMDLKEKGVRMWIISCGS